MGAERLVLKPGVVDCPAMHSNTGSSYSLDLIHPRAIVGIPHCKAPASTSSLDPVFALTRLEVESKRAVSPEYTALRRQAAAAESKRAVSPDYDTVMRQLKAAAEQTSSVA